MKGSTDREMSHKCNWLVLFAGDKALRQVVEDARKIGERCSNPAERDVILKKVGDVESMVNALSELRAQGKVDRSLVLLTSGSS